MIFVAAIVAQATSIPIPPDVQVDNTLARFDMLTSAAGILLILLGGGISWATKKRRRKTNTQPIPITKKSKSVEPGMILIVLGGVMAVLPTIQERKETPNRRWARHSEVAKQNIQGGRLEQAEREVKLAIAALDEVNAYDHRRAISLMNLAGINQSRQEYDEAIDRLKEALSIVRQEPELPALFVVNCRIALAGAYLSVNDFEAAEPHVRQAVEDCETRLPPDSNQLALALMQLGNILMSKLEMEEAKAQLDQALEMVQRNSKGIPGMAARSRLALARWHHLSGNRDRAGELYRRSIKDFEAVLPATHPDLMTAIEDFQLFSSEIELSDEQFEPAGSPSATTPP